MATDDTKDKELREALLKANGISPAGPSSEEREKMNQLIERDERQLRISKWLVQGVWGAFALAIIAGVVMSLVLTKSNSRPEWLDLTSVALLFSIYPLLAAAIYATIRYVLARASLGRRKILHHLMQIEHQLELANRSERKDE
jgi:bacteriorhodopsin